MTASSGRDSTAEVDRTIVDAYVESVRVLAPDLVVYPMAPLREQAHLILQATHAQLGQPPTGRHGAPAIDPVGTQRAVAGVHPSHSLRAANALFQVALPRLIAHHVSDRPPVTGAADVALALHTAITDRLVAASVSYIDVVMDRLNSGYLVERRRVSRDLHDRTSQGIGAAIHGVDLALHKISDGVVPDAGRLQITRSTLSDTLHEVRTMSSLLRDVVGDRTLFEALHEYVATTVPCTLRVDLRQAAAATLGLQKLIAEESYLVLREAVRNAVLHAATATRLDIDVRREQDWLVASVTDDGPGFDLAQAAHGRTVGLASMRERAESIGGTVTIDSPEAGGVRVVLRVPTPVASALAVRP